jgi:Cyclophilin type peptidyl-prolyl cis-trans isomerase/CLD
MHKLFHKHFDCAVVLNKSILLDLRSCLIVSFAKLDCSHCIHMSRSRAHAVCAGGIMIALYGKATPQTVANFEALVNGDTDGGYSYKGTSFYKIVSGLNMQAGAIGEISGKGLFGRSAKGPPFDPENFDVKHSAEGIVSMVSSPTINDTTEQSQLQRHLCVLVTL